MIFLNAPLDIQHSPAYKSALALLTERHGAEHVAADRDLFGDFKSYNKTWKQVYDPERTASLYVLAREDGTIGVGVYKQWKRLSKKHGVPATLLLPDGESVEEAGTFSITLLEEAEASDRVFAVVNPQGTSEDSPSTSGERTTSGNDQQARQVAVTARPSDYGKESTR